MRRESNHGVLARTIVASGTSHLRDSLKTILNSSDVLSIVEVVATGSQLLEELEAAETNLVVIDSDLPGLDPAELEAQLSRANFGGKVLYMGSCCSDDMATIIERFGGVVMDRCVTADEFLNTILSSLSTASPESVSSSSTSEA